MMGQGIDRHLLGLRLTAIEHGMDVPDFLMDPVFSSSSYWQLSTSQVSRCRCAPIVLGTNLDYPNDEPVVILGGEEEANYA